MRALLALLLPSLAFAQAPAVGDLFVKIPPNLNALCVHRPDGTTVACSSGMPTDWWVSGTLTADLGWVTASLGANGYDLLRFASDGTPVGSTYLPHVGNFDEVVTTADGRIVIADAYTQSLHFVTADGVPLATWPMNGSFAPNRLVVGPDDDLWVFDSSNGKARNYDASGALVGTFNTGVGTSDVARTSLGTFWLFEIGSSMLRHMDANGNLLTEVEYVHGTIPVAIAVDLDDNLWVAEWNSSEVDHLDPSGGLLGSFDALGPPYHMQVIGPGWTVGNELLRSCQPELDRPAGGDLGDREGLRTPRPGAPRRRAAARRPVRDVRRQSDPGLLDPPGQSGEPVSGWEHRQVRGRAGLDRPLG